MPEELENPQLPDDPTPDDPTPIEVDEEPKVPVRVVKELRDELRAAKENELLTRQQMTNLMTEFQKLASGQANKAREEVSKLDPEIQEALAPYLTPIKSELQTALHELHQVKMSKAQMENERYLEKNIPNLPEIREDLVAYLQNLPPDLQKVYAENPKALVPLAHAMFPAKKGAEGAKQAMRSMAKTESGATQTRASSSRPSEMNDQDRLKWMREHGWNV